MPVRPNILLILVDDMGYGDIGAFGNPQVRTPALDALCGEGVALTQQYAGSPVCAPSRASLLTGRYPHRTGVIDTLDARGTERLSLDETTLADILRASGYATGLVGKWHLGSLDPRYHPNARGFDEFAGFRGGWSDYWEYRLELNDSVRPADGQYLTDLLTGQAVQFIERHREQPFFLHVTYNAPHFPLQVPDAHADPFRESGSYTEGVSRVYGMNHCIDVGVGRMLEALEQHGLADNTLVVFASDNGPHLSEWDGLDLVRPNGDFAGAKALVYEGGIRVPGVVRWPAGLDGGRRVDGLVHFTDWMPTLLAAGGAIPPNDLPLDGQDVWPTLRGEKGGVDTRRFWQWNRYSPIRNVNAAMRDGPWKLVRPMVPEGLWTSEDDQQMDWNLRHAPERFTGIQPGEPDRLIPDPADALLYNLDEDPGEQQDLAAREPARIQAMQRALDRWFDDVEADRRRRSDCLSR